MFEGEFSIKNPIEVNNYLTGLGILPLPTEDPSIIDLFGTQAGLMWRAYLFGLLALISLPAAISSHDPIVIVAWIAQTFLQLVLLPIIIVGQNVQAAASDARAESDHETLVAIHNLTVEVHEIATQQTVILKILEERSNR